MNRTRLPARHLLALAGLALILPGAARADLITWGPVLEAAGPEDVSGSGALVTARNAWAGAATGPTVNGVTFEPFAPPGWINGASGLMAGGSSAPGYDALLDSARATNEPSLSNPSPWGGVRLDVLGSLVVGRTYEIQVWFADNRASGAANDGRVTLSSVVGPTAQADGIVANLGSFPLGSLSGVLDADPNNLAGATDAIHGSFVTGTFTRTSTAPLWLLVQGSHPDPAIAVRPQVNALQVRDVTGLTGANFGANYCPGVPNSTGAPAMLSAWGSMAATANDVRIEGRNLPPGAACLMLTSMWQGLAPAAGGSAGNLCLAFDIGRYVGPGQVLSADAGGAISLTIDLTQTPTPMGFVTVQSGQTWNYQAWYRDASGGTPISNFTTGLTVTYF